MNTSDNSTWRRYPYHTGDLSFPDEEGLHPEKPYGWWYLNMHLDDEQGDRVILFTSFVSAVNEQLGSIADLSRGRHLDQYQVGTVRAETDRLDVQFTDGDSQPNFLRQIDGEPFHYDFYYGLSGYEFSLRLEAVKPPYALGESGLVRQLPGTYSYYYVQPRLAITGTLKRDDGSTSSVSGIGWLDRQWYPMTNAGTDVYMGHFWSAIHLSDGTDIAAYRCLGREGSSPYPLFEVMGADNSYRHYAANTIVPLELFETPPVGQGAIRQFQFPRSVRILHEPTGTDLILSVAAQNPIDNALALGQKGCFFEGGFTVSGQHGGQFVTGDAFVEVSLLGAQLTVDNNTEQESTRELTEDQRLIQASARAFFARESTPDRVMALLKSGERIDRDLWAGMLAQGYLGIAVPEADGGLGSGLEELLQVAEEMGRASVPGPWLSSIWTSSILVRAAAPASLLRQILRGETRVSQVYTESEHTIKPPSTPLLSRQAGNDLIIDGQQQRVLDAQDIDDLLLWIHAADGRSCLALIPVATDGITLTQVGDLDSLRSVQDVGFNCVRITPEHILVTGEIVDTAIGYGRCVASLAAAADRIGGMSCLLEHSVDFLETSETMGQSVQAFAAVKPGVDHLLQRIESVRSTVHWAASCLEKNPGNAANMVILAETSVARVSLELSNLVNDLHEGMGLSWEHDLNLFRSLPPFLAAISVPLAPLTETGQ